MVARLSRRARTMPRRSPLTSVMPALSMATSVPVPMAMPDICLRQRGRVVDAIAGHGDDVAFATCSRLTTSRFLIGQHFGMDFVDAQLARHGFGGGAAVAGEHHDAQTFWRCSDRLLRASLP